MDAAGTQELFVRRALGRASDEDVVAWAEAQVVRLPPHSNLSALASLRRPINHFEAEELFRRALSEMGLSEPPALEAITAHLRETAQDGRISANRCASASAQLRTVGTCARDGATIEAEDARRGSGTTCLPTKERGRAAIFSQSEARRHTRRFR